MEFLPKWLLPNTFPAVYEFESMTATEQTARVYGAMQTLIGEYNKFADSVNAALGTFTENETEARTKFEADVTKVYREFACQMQNYLKLNLDDTATKVILEGMNNGSIPVPTDSTLSLSEFPADAAATGKIIADRAAALATEIAVERERINNLSTLEEGSTTGDAELADARVGYDGYTYENAGEAVRSQVGSIEGRFEPSRNLINPDRLIMDKFCNGNTLGDSTSYILTEFIPVKPSMPYWFSWVCNSSFLANQEKQKLRFVSYYDSNKTYLSQESAEVRAFTTPENAAYVRLTLYKITITDIQVPMLFEGTTNAVQIGKHPYVRELGLDLDGEKIKERTVGIEKLSEEIITTGKNLFDKSSAPFGFLGFAPDEIQENFSSVTSGYIPVKAGHSYTISPKARAYCLYDTHKDQVSRAQPEAQVTVTPDYDGFIRVSFAYNDLNTAQIEEGTEATAYEPFMRVLSPDIHVSGTTALYDYKNMLTGKKWYACGDSFTADGYGTSDQPKFEGGLYDGKNKVYPFYIGRRCGIDVTNLAVGGQTMAKVEGRGNCFSETIYQNVGADANYITIRLGINDENQNVTIGTIDDTDNTTFYGAWNVVMEYLITNHPFAHIGIIVPNGAGLEYVEAVKAIAVKWGVPYLDFATGDQVPLMHRTCRTNVTSVARNLRHSAFTISATNTHPNADAHEYESYCIENWLMSL